MEEVHGSLSYANHQVAAIPLRVSRLAASVESSPTGISLHWSFERLDQIDLVPLYWKAV
jgi:hypothetical protein